jgi:hypothetical protein
VRGERWSFRSYLCGFSPPTPRPLWLWLEREAKAGAFAYTGERTGKGWSLRLRGERKAKAGAFAYTGRERQRLEPSLTRGREKRQRLEPSLTRHRVVVFCVNSFRMRSRSDGVKLRWMPTRLRSVRGCSVLESGSL